MGADERHGLTSMHLAVAMIVVLVRFHGSAPTVVLADRAYDARKLSALAKREIGGVIPAL